MKPIQLSIKQLRLEFQSLNNNAGKKLLQIHERAKLLVEEASKFERLWVGAWGEESFDCYQNPNGNGQAVQLNDQYIYNSISNGTFNLENFHKITFEHLKSFKNYQQKLITEISVIRDIEGFKNENEILQSIEKFRWGFDPIDYIRNRRPSQVIVYDYNVLNRGLQTPPHIAVMGNLVSLMTKTYSVTEFETLITRILRQLEIKLQAGSAADDFDFHNKVLENIFNNFHSYVNQLKNRHDKRAPLEIKDEYDVQDALHAILKLHFKDIREEEYTPSYAGSSSRVDFLLKEEQIVIEVKKTREKLADKQIGEQLILDASHYKNHPNCKALICFVYDPENKVKNPRGLENDIKKESDEYMTVELFVRP